MYPASHAVIPCVVFVSRKATILELLFMFVFRQIQFCSHLKIAQFIQVSVDVDGGVSHEAFNRT